MVSSPKLQAIYDNMIHKMKSSKNSGSEKHKCSKCGKYYTSYSKHQKSCTGGQVIIE